MEPLRGSPLQLIAFPNEAFAQKRSATSGLYTCMASGQYIYAEKMGKRIGADGRGRYEEKGGGQQAISKTLKTRVPHRPGVTAATWAAATEPTSPDDSRAPTTTVSVPDTYSIPDNQYMPDISLVWSLLLHTGLYS